MLFINEFVQLIQNGAYDNTFKSLYGESEDVCIKQRVRYIDALESFKSTFGDDRQVCIYSAPGRTEIGGNHTDHNNGVVMAAAVNLDIIAVVCKNDDNFIRVKSKGFKRTDEVDITNLTPQKSEEGISSALIRGACAGVVKRGGKAGGFNAYTTNDVLRGSGLSSSAAFEVVIGAVLNGEYNDFKFTDIEIAQISQYAENVFFGKPSGLMDQTASSVGGAISIDFKDTEKPIVTRVSLELAKKGFALCITDTKGSHANLTDEYAAIRLEMEAVAQSLGKKVLREVSEEDFYNNIAKVRESNSDRAILRAAHFYADSKRAQDLCAALKDEKFDDFLSLIIQGGHSSFEYNQNAYSVKNVHEQGVSLGIALSQKILSGCGAWRLQGGGFAGTIQAFVPLNKLDSYVQLLESVFGQGACYILDVRNYGAVKITENL